MEGEGLLPYPWRGSCAVEESSMGLAAMYFMGKYQQSTYYITTK